MHPTHQTDASFLSRYFGLSLPALGVFRILFGLVSLFDVILRIPYIRLLYSNDGLLSNHYTLFAQQSHQSVSLLLALSTTTEVAIYFTLLIISLFCFIIGYRTKLFHVICAIGMVSLHNRNLISEYGGDIVSNIFWVYTLLLPLGASFSVDAKQRHAEQFSAGRFLSIASTLCVLQLAVIYFFTAIHKNGANWVDGSALYYVLHQDRIVTSLGRWAVAILPSWSLEYLTWCVYWSELAIAILILSPIATRYTRRIAVALLWILHLGLMFFISVGLFSPIMMVCAVLLLDSVAIKKILTTLRLLPQSLQLQPAPTAIAHPPLPLRVVQESVGLFLLVTAVILTLDQNIPTTKLGDHRGVRSARNFAYSVRLFQGWSMFAPEAPVSDGWLVMDLTLKSGAHLDPQTGLAPDYGHSQSRKIPWSQLWDSYSLRLSLPQFRIFLPEMQRWITERGHGMHPFHPKDVVAFEVSWMAEDTPRPGLSKGIVIPLRRYSLLKSTGAPVDANPAHEVSP